MRTGLRLGKRRALANLANEQVVRQLLEEQYLIFRKAILNDLTSSSEPVFLFPEANSARQLMLHEADTDLSALLQRYPEDGHLRAIVAIVLTQLGTLFYAQHQDAECLTAFERAATLWEQLRPEEARQLNYRKRRAITYTCLEQTYEHLGQFERAQQFFERAFHIWQELLRENPVQSFRDNLLLAALDMRWFLLNSGHSEEGVPRRLEKIRARLDRMGAGPDGDFLFNLLRLGYQFAKAEWLNEPKPQEGGLAAARDAASALAELMGHPFFDRRYYVEFVPQSVRVVKWLRRAGALTEALTLCEQACRVSQELVGAAPNDPQFHATLSAAWCEISKIRWDWNETEQTLTALRKGVEAQRQALALAPQVPGYRQMLGWRYLQLGRKWCELGNLDKAEACFSERQALSAWQRRHVCRVIA